MLRFGPGTNNSSNHFRVALMNVGEPSTRGIGFRPVGVQEGSVRGSE